MARDQAFDLMRDALKNVLPTIEDLAKHAKNTAARRQAAARAEQIKAALQAAKEV
jgi:hypothetical protein